MAELYEWARDFWVVSNVLLAVVLAYEIIDRVRWARFDGKKNMERRIAKRRKDMGML